MKVLVACEESQAVTIEFRRQGNGRTMGSVKRHGKPKGGEKYEHYEMV